MKIQLHVGTKTNLSFNLRHFWPIKIVQTAEIIEKNGLSFQDFWRYTLYVCMSMLLVTLQVENLLPDPLYQRLPVM